MILFSLYKKSRSFHKPNIQVTIDPFFIKKKKEQCRPSSSLHLIEFTIVSGVTTIPCYCCGLLSSINNKILVVSSHHLMDNVNWGTLEAFALEL